MNREEILAKAQKETDERELVIKNKAYKYASEAMALVVAVLALFFVVDGYLLENIRQFSNMILGCTAVAIYCVYGAVYEGYVGFQLKNKLSIAGCGMMTVIAVWMFKVLLSGIL